MKITIVDINIIFNIKRKLPNILNFIDILVDEVQNQETYLIDENRKPLATISELN